MALMALVFVTQRSQQHSQHFKYGSCTCFFFYHTCLVDGTRKDSLKLVLLGSSASGKSTLAGKLAKRFGLRHIESDYLHYLPQWKSRSTEEFRDLVSKAIQDADRLTSDGQLRGWVVDGNCRAARDIIWPQASHLIWLDYDFPVNFVRLTTRTVARWWFQQECCNGNRVKLLTQLAIWKQESCFYWIIKRSHRKEFPTILSLDRHTTKENRIVDISNADVFRLISPRDAEHWFALCDKIFAK